MSDIFLSDGEYAALERLMTEGPVFALDIPNDAYFSYVRLKDAGLAVMALPNPNFLFYLPPDRRSAYQFKVTREGINEYYRLKHLREEHAKQEKAQLAKDAQMALDKKKDRRHDFLVAAFGGAVTLFVEHFGDLIDFFKLLIEKALSLLH